MTFPSQGSEEGDPTHGVRVAIGWVVLLAR
jgi:hypothetical protein